ncbi:PREDICTED: disks large homolog 5-like [Myotis brandtii]|uniref:disks large homolog 5-like n=1 Tax=Myotis brandtii TaxID=109478 RepID=UPI000704397B|nr:PREDICTED: disks large homolog 5-like [Myotis brandtii]
MLVNKEPSKFCRCPLEVMKASQQAIERGVKDCLFVDYKRRSGHFDVTTVASIKEITEKVPAASDRGFAPVGAFGAAPCSPRPLVSSPMPFSPDESAWG